MNKVKDALLGLAVGDALGVPVEFMSRAVLQSDPVTGMREYGSHHQPAGTWSDDSSLTFCLADSLISGYDLKDIAGKFIQWRDQAYWTAHERVFDIGMTTQSSINRLKRGIRPDLAGGMYEDENGNGSLMRILPLAFYLKNQPDEERQFELIREVSSLTHAHIRSVIACKIFMDYALALLAGNSKVKAYELTCEKAKAFVERRGIVAKEVSIFSKVLDGKLADKPIQEISGSGYVVHTLEASLWCLLTTSSYKEAVLKAVNLGDDTDTTGAVTGGLAGILYGLDQIPLAWREALAKKEEIIALANKLNKATDKEV
ncbi:ADP-ribosylglycohydrolase family protein [Rapidithrix thailandica]|uniref:ADP-ribosylglycohydrolase family protein n=1 Tax=Rapidithrix thailandica TaxID=413964 RepID=A0AAW9S6Q0_9BACT